MSSHLYPLLLEPILVEKPWGGRRLEALGKQLPGDRYFGESWEVADLPDLVVQAPHLGRTQVRNGLHAGRTLQSLIAEFGSDLLGPASATKTGDFPLLVKYLDAREHLSVQVHPNAEYVERDPGARLKTESWYIVAADPGAVLYLGFCEGVSAEMVQEAVGTPNMVGLLRTLPAVPGGFVHVPAGTAHALGAGVLVAEIQTPSDTTFRMYDWTEEYSRPERSMHLGAGLAAIDLGQRPELVEPRTGSGSRMLISNQFYWVRETSGSNRLMLGSSTDARVLSVISGLLRVFWGDGESLLLEAGGTVVLPAARIAEVVVEAVSETIILEIGLR